MKKSFLLIFLIIILLITACTPEEPIDEEIPEGEETQKDYTPPEEPEEEEIPIGEETQESYEAPEGMIAYWRFEENTDTTEDIVNNFKATVTGTDTKPGKVNSAICFDGIDDKVIMDQDAMQAIGKLSKGTIAFWFNYESLLDKQTIMPLFHLGTDSIQDKDNIFIMEIGHANPDAGTVNPSDKKLYMTWMVNHQQEPVFCYDSLQNINANAWHHFAMAVDSTANKIYLDGTELNEHYNFGGPNDHLFLKDIPVQEILSIGYGKTHHQISQEFLYYKGCIDDLKIYNKALSEQEIKDLM